MRKTTILFVLSFLACLHAFSQRQQGVYLEILGASSSVGIHYDTRFGENTKLGGRVGLAYTYSTSLSFFEFGPEKTKGISMPIGINYLFGNKKNSFELGAGVSAGFYSCNDFDNGQLIDKDVFGIFYFLDLAYRYQLNNGLMLRGGLNLGINNDHGTDYNRKNYGVDRAAVIYPFISVGYNF